MFTKPSNKFHPSSAYRNRNRSKVPLPFSKKKEIKNRYVFLRAISVSERGFLPSLSKEPGDLQMGSLNIAHGKQAHPSCLSQQMVQGFEEQLSFHGKNHGGNQERSPRAPCEHLYRLTYTACIRRTICARILLARSVRKVTSPPMNNMEVFNEIRHVSRTCELPTLDFLVTAR